MSRGLGVVRYCTAEGGSGYIPDSQLPWQSSFEFQQMVPVWDQEPAWLRNSAPGSFTNYPRFGPPIALDGGTQPPFDGFPPGSDPVPYQTGCGMGDLVLLRSDVVAAMPSITDTARAGCVEVSNCPAGLGGWIQSNPLLAAGLALAGGYLFFGGRR